MCCSCYRDVCLSFECNCIVTRGGYSMKYRLSPRDFLRAQALFYCIPRIESQNSHSQLYFLVLASCVFHYQFGWTTFTRSPIKYWNKSMKSEVGHLTSSESEAWGLAGDEWISPVLYLLAELLETCWNFWKVGEKWGESFQFPS